MKSIARFSLWFIAVAVAILPIIVIVVAPTYDIATLAKSAAYKSLRRDFSLASLAILIVGLIDTGEVMIACKDAPEFASLFYAMWPLLVFILLFLITFSILCGSAGAAESVTPLMFNGFYASLVLAFLGRLALVVSP